MSHGTNRMMSDMRLAYIRRGDNACEFWIDLACQVGREEDEEKEENIAFSFY